MPCNIDAQSGLVIESSDSDIHNIFLKKLYFQQVGLKAGSRPRPRPRLNITASQTSFVRERRGGGAFASPDFDGN